MRKPWFRKWGWFYRPANAAGWMLTLLAAVLVLGWIAARNDDGD